MQSRERPLILIADDSRLVRELLRRWLHVAGADVLVAADGEDATAIGLVHDLDVALVDHVLPGRLGAEVIQTWRQSRRRFPIIMISAIADEQTQAESLALGANSYLTKPVSFDELLEAINFALGETALRRR